MKKLKLNLDEIKVESFETVTKKENPIGTVIGHLKEPAPTAETCDPLLCGSGVDTCGTCGPLYCYWTGPVECPW